MTGNLQSLFGGLISSKVRIRILMRLFLNQDQQAYLRELASEFSVSPSQVREELRRLSDAGLLKSERLGRQTMFRADEAHPLFPELQSMVRKALGMDQILDSIVQRLGQLELALLVGDYAAGKDTGIIDLVLVGNINPANLRDLVRKTEHYIRRKVRTLVLSAEEFRSLDAPSVMQPQLLLWQRPGSTLAAGKTRVSRRARN